MLTPIVWILFASIMPSPPRLQRSPVVVAPGRPPYACIVGVSLAVGVPGFSLDCEVAAR